jgi:hypothetical protein
MRIMIRFQPAKFGQSEVPEVQSYDPYSTVTAYRGAPVTYDTTNAGIIIFAGALAVIDLLGIMLHDVVAGVSDDPAGKCVVAKAKGQEFVGQCVNGGSDPDVVLTDLSSLIIGEHYGIIINTAGGWAVDTSETTSVIVEITRIDDDLDIVWFKILDSVCQEGV